MSQYVLTREAKADLRAIRDYLLEKDSLRAARYVSGELVSAFRSLARTPGQGHRREDLTPHEDLRFWPVFSFLIVYRVGRRPIEMIAILHGNRDVSRWLSTRR
jgi:toxin ParE1/3/4